MPVQLHDYQLVNNLLLDNGINSILYGSLGVSVYLGNFRTFDDIDLLIDDVYVSAKWSSLEQNMAKEGFRVVDVKEHEFANSLGIKVAFAEKSILIRDKICDPDHDVIKILREGIEVTTLKPDGFIRAYTFSSTDGYRITKRGDSDVNILKKLKLLEHPQIDSLQVGRC